MSSSKGLTTVAEIVPKGGHVRALGRNVVLKYASEISRLFQMAFFVIAARRFGPSTLGSLTVLLMIGSAVVLFLGDLGINMTVVTHMANKDQQEQHEVVSVALFWKILLSVLALCVMCLGMSVAGSTASSAEILSVAIISLGSLWLEFLASLTNGINRLDTEVWLRFACRGAVYGGGALGALLAGVGTTLTIMAAATLALTIAAFRVLRGSIAPTKICWSARKTTLLKESAPVWITQLAQLTYLKFDIVILGLLHVTAQETGWYAAAWKIADVLTTVPALLSAAALPLISGALGRLGLRAIVPRYLKAMYILPFFFALPLTVGAEWITRLLYGKGFTGTPHLMRILVWATVPFYVHTFLTVVAVAVGRQREAAKLAAAASILGMVTAIFLVPRLGYQAMAYVSLAANVLFACAMINSFREVTASAHTGTALKSLLAAGVALGVLVIVHREMHPLFAVAVVMVSYCAALILLRVVDLKDLNRAWRVLGAMLSNRRVSEEVGVSI